MSAFLLSPNLTTSNHHQDLYRLFAARRGFAFHSLAGFALAFFAVAVQVSIAINTAVAVDTVFILADPLAQRVAMDAQFVCGFGEIVVVSADDVEDELLFKLIDGFFKKNSADNHLVNQGFQFSFHGLFLIQCLAEETAMPDYGNCGCQTNGAAVGFRINVGNENERRELF